MTRLDTQSAKRLAKLLGMLGSNSDGERANAARMADQLVRGLGLTWSDIIAPPDLITAPFEACHDWRRTAEYCHRHRAALNDRERAFIATMLTWRGTPSERQQQWLNDIYFRLHCAGHQ
jgi:hypothetical protein